MTNYTQKETLHQKIKNLLTNPRIHKGILQGERKFIKGVTGKRIIFFPSRKMKAMMPCESRLESDSCNEIDTRQDITAFSTQSITINYYGNKEYTADAAYLNVNGNICLREVKISHKLRDPILAEKLRLIKSYLKKENIRFEIITEKELHNEVDCFNRNYLRRSNHIKIPELFIETNLPKLCPPRSNTTLGKLRTKCDEMGASPIIADALVSQGLVKINRKEKISPDSSVSNKEG